MVLKVQANGLIASLQQIKADGFTGITDFDGITDRQQPLQYSFAFKGGEITYAGTRIPSPLEFADWMQKRMKLKHLESTLKIVSTRIKNEDSLRELVDFIARFGLVRWEDLEAAMQMEIATIIEYVSPYSGTLVQRTHSEFDLSYGEHHRGLDLAKIEQVFIGRQQMWKKLAPKISLNTIPIIRLEEAANISTTILPHLNKWASGKFKLSEIAGGCGEDPLQLAQAYLKWSQNNWIHLRNNNEVNDRLNNSSNSSPPTITDTRPIILSVDDSKIVQVSIRKAVGDLYNVQFASNAMDALHALNSMPVTLLLLDVTMPDIDGLELCRTIRNIGKFKNLPIVMVTAKDGLLDKMKGQFAGSTHYLNKPVDREKLLPVLEKYILKAVAH
jgi:CheY-like chemotaxis protein